MRKHLFVVHAGSNTRGDVLFMEVCQKLRGLSLVGMGDQKALFCGACWEQYKGRCSLGGMSKTGKSPFGRDGGSESTFVVHAESNMSGDVLFMEVCQKLGGLGLGENGG